MPTAPTLGPRRMMHRVTAGLLLAGGGGVLLIAALLRPDHGLHEAMGWPVCGFKTATRLPCATCGMTTAFTYAADGDLLGALRVQPAGAILALLLAMLTLVSGYALVTGMSLAPLGRALSQPRVIVAGAVVVVAAWAYTTTFTIWTGAWPQ